MNDDMEGALTLARILISRAGVSNMPTDELRLSQAEIAAQLLVAEKLDKLIKLVSDIKTHTDPIVMPSRRS